MHNSRLRNARRCSVTIRDRDTMEQNRIKILDLPKYLENLIIK